MGRGELQKAREIAVRSCCPMFQEALFEECSEALEIVRWAKSAGQAEECRKDHQYEKVSDDIAASDMGHVECSSALVAVMVQDGLPDIAQNSASNLLILARHGERSEWPAVKSR